MHYQLLARPGRRPTALQLERMDRMLRVLARRARRDGDRQHWTWPQLARACGYDCEGMSIQRIEDRYQTCVCRTLRYLCRARQVAGWAPLYRGREPVGILVLLPQGMADAVSEARPNTTSKGPRPSSPPSVRPRHFSPRPAGAAAREPVSLSRGSCTDNFFLASRVQATGGLQGGVVTSGLSFSQKSTAARARGAARPPGPAERARLQQRMAAALYRHRVRHGPVSGEELLRAVPKLRDQPPDIVLRALVRADQTAMRLPRRINEGSLWRPSPMTVRHTRGRLSVKRRDQLLRCAERVERWAAADGRPAGASIALLADVIRGDFSRQLGRPPRELGGVVVVYRRLVRELARERRARRRARSPHVPDVRVGCEPALDQNLRSSPAPQASPSGGATNEWSAPAATEALPENHDRQE